MASGEASGNVERVEEEGGGGGGGGMVRRYGSMMAVNRRSTHTPFTQFTPLTTPISR